MRFSFEGRVRKVDETIVEGMTLGIPKKLGHIWIGPLEAPTDWMDTWTKIHPDWDYTLYDNDYLKRANFETQAQIDEYINRGQYAGAADLMRYEILWRNGGVLAPADGTCLRPIDELFVDDAELYTVYENEFVRGKLVSPILAAAPGNPFLREMIDRLKQVAPRQLGRPWKQTGNLFVAEMIEEMRPDIVIWPSHYFIPRHYTGVEYSGEGPVYVDQHFGSTGKKYRATSLRARWLKKRRKKYAKKATEFIPDRMR